MTTEYIGTMLREISRETLLAMMQADPEYVVCSQHNYYRWYKGQLQHVRLFDNIFADPDWTPAALDVKEWLAGPPLPIEWPTEPQTYVTAPEALFLDGEITERQRILIQDLLDRRYYGPPHMARQRFCVEIDDLGLGYNIWGPKGSKDEHRYLYHKVHKYAVLLVGRSVLEVHDRGSFNNFYTSLKTD